MHNKPKRLDDWFATAALANRAARARTTKQSDVSGVGTGMAKDDIVTSLQKLRDAVRNIVPHP